jgi:hypothetical protein
MSLSYNWEVLSVNSSQGYMQVKFTVDGSPDHDITLNLDMPQTGVTLSDHIQMRVPLSLWVRIENRATYLPVSPGEKGSAEIVLPTAQDASTISGDLQKARIKALIQEVLNEQQASTV